ncbi:hypothetical protein PSEUDO8Z_60388 [Pseudomonas sp. 8Z]|nr:hypothetical protein PSEUDO8Z_60388 [Pseudomonas sp. 8Z]
MSRGWQVHQCATPSICRLYGGALCGEGYVQISSPCHAATDTEQNHQDGLKYLIQRLRPNRLIKRKFIDEVGLTAVGEMRKMRATLAT